MTTQNLLFVSQDGGTLYATNGTTATVVATDTSTTPFLPDPLLYESMNAAVVGTTVYFTMADSTDTTSAI
jgi:hypothetical protein